MKQRIRKLIQEAVAKIYPGIEVDFSVDFAPGNVAADIASNAAMVLAKKVGKKPMEVAEALASAIPDLVRDPVLDSGFRGNDKLSVSVAAPGFLNFILDTDQLIENLSVINKLKDKFGQNSSGQGKLAIVEYFQLNVAKPPHVGHLRSAVIGDSLKRILKFAGYKTVSDTHIGDWGTQFGILLWAIKNPIPGTSNKIDLSDLHALYKLYVDINHAMESAPDIPDKAKKEFVLLEQGDKQNRKYWQQMVTASTRELHGVLKLLDLEKFDYELGESFYEKEMQAVPGRLEEKKLLTLGETGEKYVDLEQYGLGRLICIKSDGGTTYEMRDLATLTYRYETLPKSENAELAWNLYVVDSRQAHDFDQVFKTMGFLGYDIAKSKHVTFGFMSLPEGALSTRKGQVIYLEKLIEEAVNRAKKIIEEKNPDLKDKQEVARQVGLAAIKYFDLKHNRKSDIVFRWDEVLAFEGNTGPYLQYTYARLRSILRKANEARPSKFQKEIPASSAGGLVGKEERAVMVKLGLFEDAVSDAASDFLPNILANYLYTLAETVNGFYHAVPVLQENDETKKQFRLALVSAAAQVLENGLDLLGIEAPEEM